MKKLKTSKSQFAAKRSKERRFFSENARKAILQEIDAGLTIAEATRKYEVSKKSIYNWRKKYTPNYSPSIVTVVEHLSDSVRNKQLQAELASVYQALGRLQAENMLLNQIIELANQHYQSDLKKNFASNPSSVCNLKEKPNK